MTTIADRIKKLLELAKSSNVHEAALAASEAQRLMMKHGIESADLSAPEAVESISVERSVCFCDGYVSPGQDKITIIGRKNDVIAASILLDWLAREIMRLCDLEWRVTQTMENGKTWKNNFRIAAATEIGRRLKEGRAKAMLEETAQSSTALVRLENYAAEAKQAIMKWKADAGVRTQKASTSYRVSQDGTEAGRRAGASVNLTPPTRALRA